MDEGNAERVGAAKTPKKKDKKNQRVLEETSKANHNILAVQTTLVGDGVLQKRAAEANSRSTSFNGKRDSTHLGEKPTLPRHRSTVSIARPLSETLEPFRVELRAAEQALVNGKEALAEGSFAAAFELFEQAQERYQELALRLSEIQAQEATETVKAALLNLYCLWCNALMEKGQYDYTECTYMGWEENWEIKAFDGTFKDACKKAKAALLCSPCDVIALHCLGRCYVCRGDLRSPTDADAMYMKAENRYSEATIHSEVGIAGRASTLSPIWRSWGNVLLKRAKLRRKAVESKQKYATDAGDKFTKALESDPHDMINKHSFALYECYVANELICEAVQQQMEEQTVELLKTAEKRIRGAFAFKPDCIELLDSYANCLGILAEYEADKDKQKSLRRAVSEHTKAADWLRVLAIVDKPIRGIQKFGFLTKQGGRHANWKRRFFLLTQHALSYSQAPGTRVLGEISVKSMQGVMAQPAQGAQGAARYGFAIQTAERTYHILSDTDEAKEQWIAALQNLIALVQSIYIIKS